MGKTIEGKREQKARTKEDGAVKNRVCLNGKNALGKAGKTCGGFFTRKKILISLKSKEL